MSRCQACDELLNDYDVTVKSLTTGEYLDMCGSCRASIREEVVAFGNPFMLKQEDISVEETENEDG